MGEDEDGHGRDTGEGGNTSSTLGQAQSIEVCFGRTKLTLCSAHLPLLPIHRYHPPDFHLHPPFPSSVLRSGGACYLNEGLPTVVGG